MLEGVSADTSSFFVYRDASRKSIGMKKFNILSAILSVLLTACISEAMETAPYGSKCFAGDTLPDFRVVTTDSTVVARNQRNAPMLMVAFFHTECKDCQKELPIVEQVYRECRNDSLWQLICIGMEEKASKVIGYWKDNGFSMPVAPQPDRMVYNRFAHNGVPMLYIANDDNIILAVYDDRHPASYHELKQWISTNK